jgi:thymidylate synthase
MTEGNIPVISINAPNLPIAWEKAVIKVWDQGAKIKTEYDKKEDPASRDATVMIAVDDPFAEPRIHKNFPGGPEELESYRQEVCDGIHDHWIDPENKKWSYTYHERLFSYKAIDSFIDPKIVLPTIDQIQYIIDSLSKTFYSRRAQAITWMPSVDPPTGDPPCLQRIWCRVLKDDQGIPVLNMNTHWRSRDLYKAWFMNAYALTELQSIIAREISKNVGETVRVGRYVDITDSLHLYGSYFEDMKPELEKMRHYPMYLPTYSLDEMQGPIDENLKNRTYRTDEVAFSSMTEEAKEKLAKDPDWYKKGNG